MDQWMTLAQASKRFRRNGLNVSATAIWRWCTRGVGGMRLEHGRCGQRYVVTAEAVDSYIRQLGARETPAPPPAKPRTHQQNAEAVQRRLAERGL